MQKTGEYNSNNAFIYNGNTGNVNNNNKYNTNAVRPVSEFQGNVDPFASFYKSMRAAYRLCLKNKAHTANAIRFWLDEESELVALAREVFNCEYVPRQSIAFIVTKPCLREVVAADFRDRIVRDIPVGARMLIADGELEIRVVEKTDEELICEFVVGGAMRSRKSVNVPAVSIDLPSVTEKDRRFIEWAVKNDVDFIAHSFVRSAKDIKAVQEILDAHGSKIKIISKIENQEGLDNIDEIIEASYGIMVARGDLGVELPAEAIPNTQRRIVEKCICAKRPVIIATQMLYSMVKSPRPTRAEVSDVASAIYERVDAVMLSDETAMGDYPVESVETMARVAREIERDETHFKPMIDMDMVSVNHEITAQLARSAVRASTNLPIKYVVLDTKTGRTGRYLAAFRGRKTVMAVCYQLHAQRILALSYGVVPILRNQELHDKYHFLVDALEFLDQYRKLKGEDLLAIVGGSFGPDGGASYVEIANVDNIRRRNEEIVAAQKC